MPPLQTSLNKTLKLTNVLMVDISTDSDTSVESTTMQMENYIKSKGYLPVGPIVQYTFPKINENNLEDSGFGIRILRQVNGFINHVESPYRMTSILRVPNCLYVRYIGIEGKLNVAYNKLSVLAYENNIDLSGNSYTVFANKTSNGDLVVDVFMEKMK